MALASRIVKCDFQVCVLMSDGECNEGSVWEAAMFAAAQQLSNLTVVVDYNGWQATGRSDDVLRLAPLADKWRAFGFETCEVDGHDFAAIENAVADGSERTRPLAVVARTTKGRGVSFMEDDNNWHYRIPNDTEVAAALAELEQSS
jgi:transketolase